VRGPGESRSDDESASRWSARKWQLEQTTAFQAWRREIGGRAEVDLSTICDAVSDTVESIADPFKVAARLQEVLEKCDDLKFNSLDEAAAYTLVHMSDRYARATQVLELLFQVGRLPIRKEQLAVLDVGAGPGPCLYAALDFYQGLAEWTSGTQQGFIAVPISTAHLMERGRAWGHLIHNFSEHLIMQRRRSGINEEEQARAIPFGVQYTELRSFSSRELHHAERRLVAEQIHAEWEQDGRYGVDYSWAAARNQAYALPASLPFAYDLVFASNFLTCRESLVEFHDELRELAWSLSPGGLLVVLGGTGPQYQEIWSEAETLMRRPNVVLVKEVDLVLQAHPNQERRRLILSQLIADRDRLNGMGAELPRWMQQLTPEERYPRFQVKAWRKQLGR
jgi:ribosomal protein RSM22 (predicted rRNA methylase)